MRSETKQKQIEDIIEENQESKKIPEWVEINDYAFNKVKDKIDNAVNKNLGPTVAGNKVNYLHLQSVLEKILNKDFKNSYQAREYYAKNIYKKYEKDLRILNTTASKEMVDAYNAVKKIFIKPKSPVATESYISDTDSESGKLDIATGEEQKDRELKVMTPKQILSRLPILLAQLKAGSNSQKLKNEIRQLLYHLYRSKHLSKTIYNSLMNTI